MLTSEEGATATTEGSVLECMKSLLTAMIWPYHGYIISSHVPVTVNQVFVGDVRSVTLGRVSCQLYCHVSGSRA